jgi:hypothetical protein
VSGALFPYHACVVLDGRCSMDVLLGDFSSAVAVWIGVWGRCSAREGAWWAWPPESEEAGTDTRRYHVPSGQVIPALAVV